MKILSLDPVLKHLKIQLNFHYEFSFFSVDSSPYSPILHYNTDSSHQKNGGTPDPGYLGNSIVITLSLLH